VTIRPYPVLAYLVQIGNTPFPCYRKGRFRWPPLRYGRYLPGNLYDANRLPVSLRTTSRRTGFRLVTPAAELAATVRFLLTAQPHALSI
jgi:hypothetical protein